MESTGSQQETVEATAGLEPAHKSFADSRVTPSPRGRGN